MKTCYLLTLSVIFFLTFQLHAQDQELAKEASPLSISGSIDAYFRANLNAKNSGDLYQAPGTSFGNLPGFSLGMINLITAYEGEKVGFVADIVFGHGDQTLFSPPLIMIVTEELPKLSINSMLIGMLQIRLL